MSTATILQGDALTVLPTLPHESVDVCIADPPYGDTSLPWDRQVSGWLSLVRPLLKRHGSVWCFGSLRMFMAQAEAFEGWRLAQDIVWEKHNGSNFHADRFRRVHEYVVQFYPADVPWSDIYKMPVTTPDAQARTVRRKERPPHTGHIEASSYVSLDGGPRLQRSVLHVRSCHGYAEHPTQKPVDLIAPLLEYSCPPCGMVLDPFLGSGSTAVAALQAGLSVIGIEREPEYVRVARRRLRAVQPRLTESAS